ncbi:BRO-N domain-containing protein [Faecalibaculum rodentium]|jgi:prophage antirepressor-like protein|uniref:BRO-N domain-containing protein n=1 Tax=Faecalibaculum rodentium TaxID=1702221 RepID=UPI0026F3812C|nr:BRO family protein [Faecalibaculum rodentium]
MGDLKVFAYGEQQVRTVLVDDAPWWVLADVCKALGLTTSSRVAERLDEDEKMTLNLAQGHSGQRGGAQRLIVVNESGLYAVILRSDKPEAKKFKRWVTHEVLPSIRQTGAYAAPASAPVDPVPVAAPVAPELPAEVRLKRAELLIRAAEHPALPQDEQVRLLNQAAMDLTGMGVRSPMTGAEQFPAPAPAGPRFPRLYAGTGREEVE